MSKKEQKTLTKSERKARLEEAVAKQDHDNKVLRDVWAGKKPKKALLSKKHGGEMEGNNALGDDVALREFGPKAVDLVKSVCAHATLFKGKAEGTKPAKPEKATNGGRPKGVGARGAPKYPLDSRITLITKENPCVKGSKVAARYELYETGKMVGTFYEEGGTPSDIERDLRKGHIKLS